MIICTGCGGRNPDNARLCHNCGRKLQSQWAVPGTASGKPADADAAGQGGEPLDLDALGGGPRRDDTGQNGGAWERIAPVEHTLDPRASHMVRRCAETWFYGLTLIAGAVTTGVSEDWRYLAGAIAAAAGLAWIRGI